MDEERVEEIFEFIQDANIDLDPDPIRKGPKYLNRMVAKCRNMMNQVQKFEREATQERMMLEHRLNQLESEYEMKYNDLMSNNSEVISQPSAKDREAKVNNMLKDLKSEIQQLESDITDLNHVETVVQSKLKELKNINRDIRLQKRLIEDEIQTGNAWGDQSDQSNQISEEDIDLEDEVVPDEEKEVTPEDYDDLFGEGEGESDDQQEVEEQTQNGEVEQEESGYFDDVEDSSEDSGGEDLEEESSEEDEDDIDYGELLSDIN